MEYRIPSFRGQTGGKLAAFRMSGAANVINRRFEHGLYELTGTAYYRVTFLSAGWTGRANPGAAFPLWVWHRVARIRPIWLGDKIITWMRAVSCLPERRA